MYVCVCVFAYMYICVHICIYVYICVYIYTYIEFPDDRVPRETLSSDSILL